MNLDLMHELEPDENENDADFKFPTPLPSWGDEDKSFDSSLNCYGVVYVRLIFAQRLPCPVGSSVCAGVSLPPWRGRVRTKRVSAFLSSFDHGVCVKWDLATNAGFCSMVNAWSSEESPVPSIRIDLMFSPLGMGLLDFTMCSLVLPCETLMQSPGSWKERWCQTTMTDAASAEEDVIVPLIKLEAMFASSSSDASKHPPPSPSRLTQIAETTVPVESVQRDTTSNAKALSDTLKTIETSAIAEDPTDPTQPHLLRVASFWVPAACGVCSTVMIGRNSGFRCEECSLLCCSDCRLHVDLQIPCGSDAAKTAASQSLHNRISVSNILSIVAPDEMFSLSGIAKVAPETPEKKNPSLHPSSENKVVELSPGIGRLKLEILQGCVFDRTLPAETDPNIVFGETTKQRQGDYYARVSIADSTKTARTRTLQNTGMPKFGSPEMKFDVAHYGVEFRLDVVDAGTDAVVGTTLLTSQGVLQNQRDVLIAENGVSVFQFLKGPLQWRGKRPLKLALRTGVKNAFGSDFFVPAKTHRNENLNEKETQQQAGSISGWLEICVGLEEHVNQLYGKNPYECPPRPPPDLNMNNFQIHLSRAKELIDDANYALDQYKYIISWKNPTLTCLSLLVFVAFGVRFNAEYWGSLPFIFLVLFSVHFSILRNRGGRKKRFLRKEIDASRKAEAISASYTLHRPIGIVTVSVSRGRNLYSRDLGLPGNTSCHIFWDPLRDPQRSADKKLRKAIIDIDKSAESQHELGHTNGPYSADPDWNKLFESVESRRLKQLFQHEGGFFESSDQSGDTQDLIFPILQPFEVRSSRRDTDGRFVDTSLKSWNTSPGAVVVQVKFQDFLNNLPGFDHVLGEIVFPFSMIVERGEINGWFQVLDSGTNTIASCSVELTTPDDAGDSKDGSSIANDAPLVYISLTWRPPKKGSEPNEMDVEISYAVQEELVRSSEISRQNKFDLVGSSIGAVNTALGIGGNVQVVQNTLGSILDSIECAINAFNFTDPFKSSLVFLVLSCVWLILTLIPTRIIILSLGLVQYGMAFVYQYDSFFLKAQIRSNSTESEHASSSSTRSSVNANKRSAIEVWLTNAIRSLPTNEDLRKTYFWESRRLGAQESEKHASEKRYARLKRLWKAQWYSSIKIRMSESKSIDKADCQWRDAFAVIQGHRFLWWENVGDFDNGKLPIGRLFLSGHAGLTGPSPLEIRELRTEELDRVIGIFGRGIHDQQRIMMLVPHSAVKANLETAVSGASVKED